VISINAGKRGAVIHGPDDPALARVWASALTKYEQQHGAAPADREAMRWVIDAYQRMLGKARGSLGEVVGQLMQQRCTQTKALGD
jgi:hypothetical protein